MLRQPKKDQAGPLMVRAYLSERATRGAVKPHPVSGGGLEVGRYPLLHVKRGAVEL